MSAYIALHGMEIVFGDPVVHENPPEKGDKVSLLPGRHHPRINGKKGEITAIDNDLYKVYFGDFQWWMSEDEFEIINPKTN